MQKKKQIALDLEKLQKQMKKSLAADQNNKNEEIAQKQELLNKMVDELMSDEMKKLYDELSDLINEMNKNNVLEKMEDIDLSQENLRIKNQNMYTTTRVLTTSLWRTLFPGN